MAGLQGVPSGSSADLSCPEAAVRWPVPGRPARLGQRRSRETAAGTSCGSRWRARRRARAVSRRTVRRAAD